MENYHHESMNQILRNLKKAEESFKNYVYNILFNLNDESEEKSRIIELQMKEISQLKEMRRLSHWVYLNRRRAGDLNMAKSINIR
jgi:predicted  nucleic acid-binding Zn-ribbon protein